MGCGMHGVPHVRLSRTLSAALPAPPQVLIHPATIPVPRPLASFSFLFSLRLFFPPVCSRPFRMCLHLCLCLPVLLGFCPLRPAQEAEGLTRCLGATRMGRTLVHPPCNSARWPRWHVARAPGCRCTPAWARGPKPTGVCRQLSAVTLTGRWVKYRVAYARRG